MSESIKLYPPIIDSVLPAAAGNTIYVPYKLNRAVSLEDFNFMRFEITQVKTNKKIITGKIKCTYQKGEQLQLSFTDDLNKKLNVGEFYKIQIAFIHSAGLDKDTDKGNGTTGYYSEVAIFKYVEGPTISLSKNNFKDLKSNLSFSINYSEKDPLEKIYSYRIQLYQGQRLIKDSKEKIHGNSNTILWPVNLLLTQRSDYKIVFNYTTINNYKNKKEFTLNDSENYVYKNNGKNVFDISLNVQDGCIDGHLYINGGIYYVYRQENNGYYEYQNLQFSATNSEHFYFKDYDLKQNSEYKYRVYVNSGGKQTIYTLGNEETEQSIVTNFDTMYLYDNDKCLKLEYNPKVSSIKPTILEQKTNTIGGKYPFIFRNGNVYYYEIPISALLSYRTDTLGDFINLNKVGEIDEYNLEREYKFSVLEWLTNGKPKVLRSPAEGNYIVQMTNVSLAPNDTLGRMLHTLSSTAVEIDDYTPENLTKYNLRRVISRASSNNQVYENQSRDKTPSARVLNGD